MNEPPLSPEDKQKQREGIARVHEWAAERVRARVRNGYLADGIDGIRWQQSCELAIMRKHIEELELEVALQQRALSKERK